MLVQGKSYGHDCGDKPPQVREIYVDGETRMEKLSWMPHIHMVDKQGNQVRVSLTNGSGCAERHAGQTRVRRRELAGHFNVAECPMSRHDMIRHVDADLRSGPCSPEEFGWRKPCKHVRAMQERRQAINKAKAEAYREAHKSLQERQFEISKAAQEITLRMLENQNETLKKSKR